MTNKAVHEITPLTQSDCFTVFSRVKSEFNFPLHYHEEFELNFIQNGKGTQRVIGDHVEEIDALELVFLGPNLPHAWFTHKCKSKEIFEITVQFHCDFLDEKFLQRAQMRNIRSLFERSVRGILFSRATTEALRPRLMALPEKSGFDSVLELLSILHNLSVSQNMRTLASASFGSHDVRSYNSRRVEKVIIYLNRNFDRNVTLSDAAKLADMTPIAFSRFFKQRTGKNFIDALNDIRLSHASRMLIETTQSVNEIAYKCGFNNMSNFNRIFKKKKECTPKAFRQVYNAYGMPTFI